MAAQAMEILAYLYANRAVRSVFIYTREAHPGENYRHHTSIEDKRRNARAFREQSGVCRQILPDDLGGSAHRPRGFYSLQVGHGRILPMLHTNSAAMPKCRR